MRLPWASTAISDPMGGRSDIPTSMPPGAIITGCCWKHNFIETPCSALHRRSGLASTGVFDESVQGAEDHELYLRTARQSTWIAHEAPVAEYRLHDSNTSRDAEQMLWSVIGSWRWSCRTCRVTRRKLRLHRRGSSFCNDNMGGVLRVSSSKSKSGKSRNFDASCNV